MKNITLTWLLCLLQADRFVKSGRALRRKMWWNNCKMKVVMAFVVVMVIIIIFLLICFSSSVKCIKHKPKIETPPSNSTATPAASPEGSSAGHRRLLMELLTTGMLLDA